MDSLHLYDAFKFEKGSVAKVTDPLTVESPLQININGNAFTVVLQTPGNEVALARGLLFAEDVIIDFNLVEWHESRNKRGMIEILNLVTPLSNLGEGIKSSRSLLSVSSCGICGKREIEDLMPKEAALNQKLTLSITQLESLFVKMGEQQKLFEETGGCHGIAAFDESGNLLSIQEDIGRHNALDKVIGELIGSGQLKKAKILTLSGRTSYEMVSKAFRAKIPIIAAVSAPSSLAVDFAKEFGLTLIGFCRENKATVYTCTNRIVHP